jgi:CheY-like chemotaxis protein
MIRVLLVDDDETNRELMALFLTKEGGCHVDTAANGQQALHHLQGAAYAVVVLDLRMPVMTGWEVLAQMRAGRKEDWARVPVVVLTATGREITLQPPVVAELQKPFDPELLLAALARHARPGGEAKP